MTKSKTSDDVETITINYDTNSVYDTDMSSGNFTISLDNTSFSTTDDLIARQFDSNWVYAQMPFVDSMPSLDRINSMCSEYPALAKAYEQFKFIYKMTEQDYKGKLKERGLDDDIPF